jgi:alpha/beta superfamily hydrolase
MRSSLFRVRALSPLVVGLLAAAAPGTTSRPAGPPPGPPSGTYVYELSRNGADQGTTTVVVYRRDDAREIEVDEAGSLGAASAHVVAAYRYDDLSVASYVATYQAPFLRTSPIGAARRAGTETPFYDQSTVRYRIDGTNAIVSVDGAPSLAGPDPLPRASNAPKRRYVLDAPFMASVLMLPSYRHRTGDASLAPVAAAFNANAGVPRAAMGLVRATPHAPKTPKNDDALQVDGIATVWFDRGNYIVHEAHFDALNLDARLVSYARPTHPAPFEPAPTPTPDAKLAAAPVSFDSDGTTLAGVVDMPPNVKRPVPIVAFVDPGPAASRNFGGEGPNPMYPDLARAFAARGYAVLRYDTRGIGRSGGTSANETWEASLADAQAAIRSAAEQDGIDPKRVYAVGYGSGADLALAASSTSDVDVAGVVALAPTIVSYRACAMQRAEVAAGARSAGDKAKADAIFAKTAGRISPGHDRILVDGRSYDASDGSFAKTSYGHDPSQLALRATAPLFVLHPGIPTCGETRDQTETYDDRLRAANPRATIVVAGDLSDTFGGRYDADSDVDTQAIFPYRFDTSTVGAIADWLDSPKTASTNGGARRTGPTLRSAPPPPPPAPEKGDDGSGVPNAHPSRAPQPTPAAGAATAAPGQPGFPETLATPTPNPPTAPPTAAPAPAPTPVPTAPYPAPTVKPT